MAGAAADAAISVAKGALDAVTGFLGIGSPSKVARNQVGVPWGQGVIQGMLSQARGIERAAMRAVGASVVSPPTIGAAAMSTGSRLSVAGANAAAANGAGVSVNYYGPVTITAVDREDAARASRDIGWGVAAALRARGVA
jgi:hypothetical protein